MAPTDTKHLQRIRNATARVTEGGARFVPRSSVRLLLSGASFRRRAMYIFHRFINLIGKTKYQYSAIPMKIVRIAIAMTLVTAIAHAQQIHEPKIRPDVWSKEYKPFRIAG